MVNIYLSYPALYVVDNLTAPALCRQCQVRRMTHSVARPTWDIRAYGDQQIIVSLSCSVVVQRE